LAVISTISLAFYVLLASIKTKKQALSANNALKEGILLSREPEISANAKV